MTLPDWLDDDIRRRIVAIFRDHQVNAAIYVANELDPTEVDFVVGPVATLPESTLTRELTKLLGRKVGVTTDSETWDEVGLDRLDD